MDMKDAGCKYQNTDPSIIHLVGIYSDYVVEGNTPLIDLPYEIAQAASIIEKYKAKAGLSKVKDKQEREEQRQMLASLGIKI